VAGPFIFDRVRETTITAGTGALTLAGAATGFRTFTSVLANGDTCYYCAAHQSADEWEVGIGTFTTSGTTLARTTVLASSNAGAAVNFSAGTKDVFVVTPTAVLGDSLPEIAVTGTATATIDRRHVCSGTTANYTVTLPAASGNAGRRLWLRMSAALTKLVTLDGNGSETIDGALTRVMWAGESCELLSDGSNWFKVSGKTKPIEACARRVGSNQGIDPSTWTQIVMNSLTRGQAFAWDSGNGRLVVPRDGTYLVSSYYYATGGPANCYIGAFVDSVSNSGVNNGLGTNLHVGGSVSTGSTFQKVACTAGQYACASIYALGAAMTVLGDTAGVYPEVTIQEVPSW